ncbi:MAG: chemoreceptor glutamine deamidase CheD [Pseudomonadales bacterium]|nr:chemoreceptor glutamine deamidase CheD [Pseudomonadales bacterium]MCP5185265.1 chemoreceptor glutamine deamidase CheD [Pseudomonadales bacterium]
MSRMLNKGTPGFEHVPRFWDAARAATIVKVLPGQYYVSSGGELLATVLGSCVSACIRDTRAGVGGVNHFMLPDADGAQAGFAADAPHRYGSFAMEAMLNELYKRGASRRNLEVKVVGGGAVMRSSAAVGERNIRFVREFLENEGMPIAAQDVGDACARRVLYDVTTGKMLVKRLQGAVELDVTAEEENYRKTVSTNAPSGDIELF